LWVLPKLSNDDLFWQVQTAFLLDTVCIETKDCNKHLDLYDADFTMPMKITHFTMRI